MEILRFFKKLYNRTGSKAQWFLVLFLILFKNAYYLFSYYPIADDNNMYGVYRLSSNLFEDVILHYKLYSVRPALAVIDTFLLSRLWDRLGVALFIMTLLLFLCAFLLYKILEALDLKIGLLAIALFALLPFGNEATYWLSASSRLVAGLFFLLLSFYLLCLTFDVNIPPGRRRLFWMLYFPVHLVSLCFYEQIISMSFLSLVAIVLFKWKALRPKWALLPAFLNYGFIAWWYAAFSGVGNVASRGQLVEESIPGHLLRVINAVYDQWKLNFLEFYNTGIGKSFEIIKQDGAYGYLLAAVLLCAVLPAVFDSVGAKVGFKKNAAKLTVGLMLFIAPYLPFFLLSSVWIAPRNIFLSFIGLGIMVEALFSMLPGHAGATLAARKVLVGGMVFILLTANVYELNYYRKVALIDREITTAITLNTASGDYFDRKKNLLLFNTKQNYLMETPFRMGNCTGADWSLTGALEAHSGRKQLKLAYPIPAGAYIPLDENRLESSVLLGMDDARAILPLTVSKKTGNVLTLSSPVGEEFGEMEFDGSGTALFRLH